MYWDSSVPTFRRNLTIILSEEARDYLLEIDKTCIRLLPHPPPQNAGFFWQTRIHLALIFFNVCDHKFFVEYGTPLNGPP
jgi:hypothetical protein